jgi:hypothetical protein
MAKHFDVTITGTTLAAERKQAQIAEEAGSTGSTSSAPRSPQPSSGRRKP